MKRIEVKTEAATSPEALEGIEQEAIDEADVTTAAAPDIVTEAIKAWQRRGGGPAGLVEFLSNLDGRHDR